MVKLVLTKLGLKRLEPYDKKLSRTVLRGRRRWQHLLCYPTLKQVLQMLLIMSSLGVYAQYEVDETLWAQDIAAMQISDVDFSLKGDASKQRPNLQIFVSSTMPESVLSNLVREASKYDGVLVFRGLPQGSMMELSNLVMRISSNDHPAAMQIDDEAFQLYGIEQVPSFVLSQTKSESLWNCR